MNKARIIWSLYNVGIDESITVDSVEEEIPRGYYSFVDLSSTLNVLGITVTRNRAGHSDVSPPSGKTINLKNLGILLGFPKNETLTKKTTSPYIASIYGGLSTISIFCDRVDTYRNYEMGKRSEKVSTILIPPKNLFGITTEHNLETSAPLENGSVSTLNFRVTDDSSITDKDSFTIFADCEIV